MAEKKSKRQLARRTLLEAAGGFVAAGLVGGAYLLGSRRPARDWEDVEEGRPLRVLAHRDDTANGQRRLLIHQWNAQHGLHQAEMVELPPIADLQYSAIHAALQAESRDVDVVDLDVVWIAEFAAAGHLEPFDDLDTRGFLQRPLDAGRVDGEWFALPFNTNVGMLYYRKAEGDSDYSTGALSPEEANSIKDWNGLRVIAEQMLSESQNFKGGIAMQLAPYEGFTVNVWEYLLANGADVEKYDRIEFGKNGENANLLLKSLAADLHDEVKDGSHMILQDSLQHTEDESLLAFQNGETPFLRHWPQAIRTLRPCELNFEVGVVPMPGGVLGGESLAVSAYSKRKNVSRALVEFLTNPGSQQLLFERGGFAATRHEPYFDAIAQLELGVPSDGSCESVDGPRAEAEPLHDALNNEGPGRPSVKRYTQFSRAFQDELHPMLAGNDVSDLDDLESRLSAAIEGK